MTDYWLLLVVGVTILLPVLRHGRRHAPDALVMMIWFVLVTAIVIGGMR
jgi:hypothetical protein